MKVLILSVLLSNTSCDKVNENINWKYILPDKMGKVNDQLIRAKRFVLTDAGEYFEGKAKEFANALAHGNFSKMETMIKNREVDINHVGKEGVSFIIYAYRIKSKSGLKELLKLGADVNLVTTRPSPNIKILREVDREELYEVQTDLLREIADTKENDLEWVDIVMQAGGNACVIFPNRLKSLQLAVSINIPMFKRMVENGADPNCENDTLASETPLFSLAMRGRWDLVYWCYERGVDLTGHLMATKQSRDERGGFVYTKYKWYLKDIIQKSNHPNDLFIKEYNALVYKKTVKDVLRKSGVEFPELEEWEVKEGKTESYEKQF